MIDMQLPFFPNSVCEIHVVKVTWLQKQILSTFSAFKILNSGFVDSGKWELL